MIKGKKNTDPVQENKEDDVILNGNKDDSSGKIDIQNNIDINPDLNNEISDLQKLESELESKIKEIESLTDTMKRRQADFENHKKRMLKMQDEQKKMTIKDFAAEVLNVYDDLLRAKDAACNVNQQQTAAEICNSFGNGFSMISKRIEEILAKFGIEEIDSLNKPFDPNFNEAVEIDQSKDVETDTITRVHQKGFRLDEYLVRSAKVKVTKPAKDITENAEKNEESNN